jgi:hypothetical protein
LGGRAEQVADTLGAGVDLHRGWEKLREFRSMKMASSP